MGVGRSSERRDAVRQYLARSDGGRCSRRLLGRILRLVYLEGTHRHSDAQVTPRCYTFGWNSLNSQLHDRKSGLTYFNPQVGCWSRRFIPIEAAAIDASRVLLFAITRETRSLSAMALAAHYIGLGCNVVLAIQKLSDDCVINGEKVNSM